MRLPGTVKWVALALLGLAIAGGVAFAASRLASQQIGIAAESIKAGEALAPSGLGKGGGEGKGGHGQTTTTPTSTSPETTEEPIETVPTTPVEPPATTPETSPSDHSGEDPPGGGGGDD